MGPQTYGYTAHLKPGNIEYIYRPLLNVEISNGANSRTFKALVDSGTEITAADQAIALVLGIDPKECQPAELSAIGVTTKGFLAPVSFKIERFDHVFNFRVFFGENLSENFDIILGQQDFFLNFNVTFKKSQNTFHLEAVF